MLLPSEAVSCFAFFTVSETLLHATAQALRIDEHAPFTMQSFEAEVPPSLEASATKTRSKAVEEAVTALTSWSSERHDGLRAAIGKAEIVGKRHF